MSSTTAFCPSRRRDQRRLNSVRQAPIRVPPAQSATADAILSKLDDLALMEALKSPAFYVGALGSRANNAKRRQRLQEFDLTVAQVARLHGPIGLFIGSRTPPEIAVSILAELTAVKNGVRLDAIATVAAAKEQLGPSKACSVAEESG